MSSSLVVALDIGTSSVRAIAFDASGQQVAPAAQIPYQQHTTPDGGVEIEADFLLDITGKCLDELLPQLEHKGEIVGVGISCFWHSLMAVGEDGKPRTGVWSWADNRSAGEIETLRKSLDEKAAHERLGCVIHTSYWPAKLLWAKKSHPELFEKPLKWMGFGEYLALVWHGEARMSLSMASGTSLFRQNECEWDDEMLGLLPIEKEQLPRLCDAHDSLPTLKPEFARRWPQLGQVPWFPAMGDGACSNLGSGCADATRIGINAGTSGALRVVLHDFTGVAPEGLWRYRIDKKRSLVGGALSNAGNVFAWVKNTLQLPDDWAEKLEAMAPDSHGLTVLPFLAGERAPLWNGNARFALMGAGWDATPIAMLRAILEAVALRFGEVGGRLHPLAPEAQMVVSGGVLEKNAFWGPILCDVLGAPLLQSHESEASARGAALIALEGLKLISDIAAMPFEQGKSWKPDMDTHALYQRALERQNTFYEQIYP